MLFRSSHDTVSLTCAIGFGAETYAQVKEQVFDDLVGDFMRDKWGYDWQDNDEA